MHQMSLESSFGIIPFQIINDSLHVLLIKLCSGNHWSFPKGHQEPNESPLETAQRELKEETALVIASFIDLPPFVENYLIEKKEGKVQKTVTYFPDYLFCASFKRPIKKTNFNCSDMIFLLTKTLKHGSFKSIIILTLESPINLSRELCL